MILSGIHRGKKTRIEVAFVTRNRHDGYDWRVYVDGEAIMTGFTTGAREEALHDAQVVVQTHIDRPTVTP